MQWMPQNTAFSPASSPEVCNHPSFLNFVPILSLQCVAPCSQRGKTLGRGIAGRDWRGALGRAGGKRRKKILTLNCKASHTGPSDSLAVCSVTCGWGEGFVRVSGTLESVYLHFRRHRNVFIFKVSLP